jgi:DNA-binding transcriptional LysR family regulator
MMIRHLPYFLVVAEEQHFQRAADRLRITQSALSRRIRLLEEELELQLFDRLARGVRLTAAGESLFQDAQQITFALDQAKERARKINRGLMGKIDVGVNPSVLAHPIVLKVFQIFRSQNPDIQIGLKISDSDTQTSSLQHQESDIGIYYAFNRQRDLTYYKICDDKLVLAISEANPLARKRSIRLEDLTDTPFVWPTRSVATRYSDFLIAACHAQGFNPKIGIEAHMVEPILTIVAMGLGVGFITESRASTPQAGVVTREIEDLRIELPLCMVWRSNYTSPILARMVSALTEAKDEMPLGTSGAYDRRPGDRPRRASPPAAGKS